MTIRIVIADDHGVLRAGLRSLLNEEPDLEVVGEAADGHEALRVAGELQPDLVLLDLDMPGMGGLSAAEELKRTQPDMAILILTVHEDDTLLQEAIRAGASGFIVKRAVESELINAIHSVVGGDIYVHPAMTRALLKGQTAAEPAGAVPPKPLSTREVEVLRLIAQGYTSRQIAEALYLSVRTVESHRASISHKLGLNGRLEMVQYAREHGLLKTAP
jgi:two-component system, NarL family, response regulator NreC